MRKPRYDVLLVIVMLFTTVLACGSKVDQAAPSITINLPASGSTFGVGETVEIVSTASGDAGIAQVTLYVDGQVVNMATPPQGNPTTYAAIQPWRPEQEGEYRVTVIAQDLEGKESESGSVMLVVTEQVEPTVTPTLTPIPPPTGTIPPCEFDATIVEDLTIPDRETISPGETFTKIWRIQNSGTCDWPFGTQLSHHRGDQLDGPSKIQVPATEVGSIVDISFDLTAPREPRSYTWIWSLTTEGGPLFGPYFIVTIIVPETPTPTRTPIIEDDPPPSITPTYTPKPEARIQRADNLIAVAAGDTGQAVVSCPDDSIVTSGGYSAIPEMFVYSNFKSGNGWQVYGVNNSASEALLHVYATCLSNTNGIISQVYEQVSVPSGGITTGSSLCPEGAVVTGGGWASNADGSLNIYNSSKSGNGWQIYARNTSDETKFFNAYAMCLSGTEGVSDQRGEKVNITAGSTGAVKASCENSALATGGGFAINTDLYIYNSSLEKGSDSTWWAYAVNPTGANQLLGSYVICMTFP